MKRNQIPSAPEDSYIGQISDISLAITQDHHHVLYYWVNSGIRDALLLHIDAHADMAYVEYPMGICSQDLVKIGFISPTGTPEDKYFTLLSNGSFICPAIHYGIVASVLWINPHYKSERIKFYGTTIKQRHEIATREYNGGIFWENQSLISSKFYFPESTVLGIEDIDLTCEWILDIDLDAFACHRCIEGTPRGYDGVLGWDSRIVKTIDALSKLQKPSLISITKSQKEGDKWVPSDIVDEVQDSLLEELLKIYTTPPLNLFSTIRNLIIVTMLCIIQ